MTVFRFLLILIIGADAWFIYMQKAAFYSDAHAWELAQQGLAHVVEDSYLYEDYIGPEVRFVDRSLLQRIMDIPSVYSKGHMAYPVHEFMSQYEEEGEQWENWVGILPSGWITYRLYGDKGVWERLDVYEP